MRNKIPLIGGLLLISLLVFTMPVQAQSEQSTVFICEKSFDDGSLAAPDNPQYDSMEYDSPLQSVLYSFSLIVFVGLFIFGIVMAIYSTIKDLFYDGTDDEGGAKYKRMRASGLLIGFLLPAFLIILSWIIELLTYYESTCMIPNFM